MATMDWADMQAVNKSSRVDAVARRLRSPDAIDADALTRQEALLQNNAEEYEREMQRREADRDRQIEAVQARVEQMVQDEINRINAVHNEIAAKKKMSYQARVKESERMIERLKSYANGTVAEDPYHARQREAKRLNDEEGKRAMGGIQKLYRRQIKGSNPDLGDPIEQARSDLRNAKIYGR